MTEATQERERWGSRVGLILAAAGNAIGIGNLLRFPGQAGQNGGGAFLIPYLFCLLFLGLPMMWVAWTIGRYGGRFGHGTTPGMFDRMWSHPAAKYVGAVGIALPMIFVLYYTYVEAWCLGYAWFSFTGDFVDSARRTVDLRQYLYEFQAVAPTQNYFSGYGTVFAFLLVTMTLNVFVIWRGVSKGIELLAKIAMPLLFLFCVVLAVRVFTLPAQKGSVTEGLAFLWTPDFSALAKPGVWLAAAGQIFFTLSIGFGSLECYASYLREEDDVALNALTTASTNEFVEVIFGSAIAIPALAVFFGGGAVPSIAAGGTFDMGMVAMPEVLRSYPGLKFYGTLWFLLLFFAAFTSSVAVAQPVVAFLQDEAKWKKSAAAIFVGVLWLLGSAFVMVGKKHGVEDEMDFWAGQMGLVVFALLEVWVFVRCFGMDRGWAELHKGADIRVPRVFYGVIRFVTPILLLGILAGWLYFDAIRGGKLKPQPDVRLGVVGEHLLPGRFNYGQPRGDATRQEEGKRAHGQVLEAVRLAGRDLEARGEVTISAGGEVRVTGPITGDAELTRVLTPEYFGKWLQGKHGIAYEVGGKAADTPSAVRVLVAARSTARMVWVTRLVMLGFLLAAFLAIRALWGRRAATAGGAR